MKFKLSKFPPDIAGYYKDLNKSFAKYVSVNKQNSGKTADYLSVIPANGHDICNYVAKYDVANFQIQAVMMLDSRLDFYKLVRAVRLSIEAEPVFGCHFVKSDPPYWKRFDDIDNVKFCSMEETENVDEAVQRFLESPLDMDNGPVVKVKLVRSGSKDTLCVKLNHACCDAAGAREYILMLSDIYSRIDQGEAAFVPQPSIRSRKDQDSLVSALAAENPETTWGPLQQFALPTWKFPWRNSRMGSTCFSVCKLPSGHLDIMKSYGKARDATINDLILAAVYRAMFDISKPPYGVPMDIPVTVDLRRYLPEHKTEAIRNLAGGLVIRLARKAHEPFEGTLSRVMTETSKIKNGHPSVKNALWADVVEKMSFHQIRAYFWALSQVVEAASKTPFYVVDRCSPVLSNFGFISRTLIKFGERVVTDAYIIPPVVRAPGILLVASTYNGVMMLGVGFYMPSVKKDVMEELLNKIRDELVKGCSE